jgi:hypothetical protein
LRRGGVKHQHRLPSFIDFINYPINIGLLTVKQVLQFSLALFDLLARQGSSGEKSERIYATSTVLPASNSS